MYTDLCNTIKLWKWLDINFIDHNYLNRSEENINLYFNIDYFIIDIHVYTVCAKTTGFQFCFVYLSIVGL